MSLTAETPAAPSALSRAQRVSFSFAIRCISRFFHLRDRVFGWTRSASANAGVHERTSRHAIESAENILDAVFVAPASETAFAAVLLCHGIGETVEHWFGVQQLLAAHGVASLVFDYSGYGRSTGKPDWDQFECDTIAAFSTLRNLVPKASLSILGFSLGSGVAVATVSKLSADQLILCEAFTSFREAAVSAWLPKPLASLAPPIWHARESLSHSALPVLIVHGEKDRLFPVRMVNELAGYCSPRAEIVLVPDTAHNQPFRKPHLAYWGPIVAWLGERERRN